MNAECQNEERPILTVKHPFLFLFHLQNEQQLSQFNIHLASFSMITRLPRRQRDGEAELRVGPERYLYLTSTPPECSHCHIQAHVILKPSPLS